MNTPASPGIHPLRMSVDLLGAPAIWVALHSVGYALSSQACYPHTAPSDTPVIGDFGILMGGIAVVSVIASLACLWGALQTWRRVKGVPGAYRFMAGLGVLTSILFFIGTVFTTFAILLVSPCSPWK